MISENTLNKEIEILAIKNITIHDEKQKLKEKVDSM